MFQGSSFDNFVSCSSWWTHVNI